VAGAALVSSAALPLLPSLLFALAGLALILLCARAGGWLAVKAGQPAVLGELLAGVVLGNLPLEGGRALGQALAGSHWLALLGEAGAIVLLFLAGLESTLAGLRAVGLRALLVAVVGVAAPLALGWGVGALLLPGASVYTHAFLGAALSATSVGITARVLKDLGELQREEARIILGAAVIDDVLGLLVLAVVAGVIAAAGSGASFSALEALAAPGKALLFFAGALLFARYGAPPLFRLAGLLRSVPARVLALLLVCALFSWAAGQLGLAPIVGAFTAGLLLGDGHARAAGLAQKRDFHPPLERLGAPIIPVFFVLMGVHTDLRALLGPGVPLLTLALTAAAVLGKQACALGALGSGGRLSGALLGFGMIPRGEVGLLFASIGSGLALHGERVVSPGAFSALVSMVVATTLLSPPLLRWGLRRAAGRS
jgi:Kef-type K+ transport system membrane component KefB